MSLVRLSNRCICHASRRLYRADKAKRTHGTSPDTPCSFHSPVTNHDRHENGFATSSGPAIDVADDVSANMLRQTATSDRLELSPWVNQVHDSFTDNIHRIISNFVLFERRH